MRTSTPTLLRALLFACALPAAAFAQVTFAFTYNDVGTGFNDPSLGATRQAALQSAADTLASYFSGYTATITFSVSTNNSGGYLASAGSNTSYSVYGGSGLPVGGFYSTSAQNGILTNSTGTGQISWNFSYTWDYDNSVASGAYDFKSVAMHEILHTLGYFSWVDGNSQGAANQTSGSEDVWSKFDQFLTTSDGTRLVDSSGRFNTSLATLLTDGVSSDVYFSGTNAMAANGGNRVRIYSPAGYVAGSSMSHLDTAIYGSNNYIMTHAVATGQSLRTLSAIELGMLQDIGYNVSAVPEPATYALGAGLLVFLFVAARRRRTV